MWRSGPFWSTRRAAYLVSCLTLSLSAACMQQGESEGQADADTEDASAVIDGGGEAVSECSVAESPVPIAIATPDEARPGEPVQFRGDASYAGEATIDSYEWSFGDGTNATGPVVVHGFESAGDYTVELTVTDDEGQTFTDEVSVTISDSPAPGLGGVVVDSSGCPLRNVEVTALEKNGDQVGEVGSTTTSDAGKYALDVSIEERGLLEFSHPDYVDSVETASTGLDSQDFRGGVTRLQPLNEPTPIAAGEKTTVTLDNGVELTVPAGAVGESTELSFNWVAPSDTSKGFNSHVVPDSAIADRVEEGEQLLEVVPLSHGGIHVEPDIEFEKSVSISIPIDESVKPDVTKEEITSGEAPLAAYFYDTEGYRGIGEDVESTPVDYDADQQALVFEVDHFSSVIVYDDFGPADYIARYYVRTTSTDSRGDKIVISCDDDEAEFEELTYRDQIDLSVFNESADEEFFDETGDDTSANEVVNVDYGTQLAGLYLKGKLDGNGWTSNPSVKGPCKEGIVTRTLEVKIEEFRFYKDHFPAGDPTLLATMTLEHSPEKPDVDKSEISDCGCPRCTEPPADRKPVSGQCGPADSECLLNEKELGVCTETCECVAPECGNGEKEPGEDCDGSDDDQCRASEICVECNCRIQCTDDADCESGNCTNSGTCGAPCFRFEVNPPAERPNDLHIKFQQEVELVDSGKWPAFEGAPPKTIGLWGPTLNAGDALEIKVRRADGSETPPEIDTWWWTRDGDMTGGRQESAAGCKER